MKKLILILAVCAASTVLGEISEQTVFERGMNGYRNIRIPSIVKTTKGALVAFAEGVGQIII
jgi:hypothetical protein